jgi:hypothetical protein
MPRGHQAARPQISIPAYAKVRCAQVCGYGGEKEWMFEATKLTGDDSAARAMRP